MKRLVLIGAGHAHLIVLEALARRPLSEVEVVVVSPRAETLYSGMVPGWVAGDYPREALSFDVAGVARAAGARLVVSALQHLDAEARVAVLEDGTALPYDLASLNVGSKTQGDALPGVVEHAIGIKPIERAVERLALVNSGSVVVVGGGAAGVELALCLRSRTRGRIVLVAASAQLPEGATAATDRLVRRALAQRQVELVRGRAAAVERGAVLLEGGERVEGEQVLWVTGARAPEVLGEPRSSSGFLSVSDMLQSRLHPTLFGAGDCIDFASGQRVSKAGVYSVREAPVLAHNLVAMLEGRPLQAYQAQAGFLALLNVGDGTAIGSWRGRAASGRWVWHLKDRIDRCFMRRFHALAQTVRASSG
jgi:pyridine nucleotide-disulfide oxidoreductase family protein